MPQRKSIAPSSTYALPFTIDRLSAYSVVSQLWEALSPDPMLKPYRDDYKWLTDVYESVRPADITGRLVWHALGAKTIELINQNIKVEVPQGAETIVLDAETIARKAMSIAAEICVYTNSNIVVETLDARTS